VGPLQSATATEAAYGPNHPQVAIPLTNLGVTLGQLGELSAARATLERALAIAEAAFEPDHPQSKSLATVWPASRRCWRIKSSRVDFQLRR
jgi:Tfp pilus assembly protein PilF